jgi:hypothetical protein
MEVNGQLNASVGIFYAGHSEVMKGSGFAYSRRREIKGVEIRQISEKFVRQTSLNKNSIRELL